MKRFLRWLLKPSNPSHISSCFWSGAIALFFAIVSIRALPDMAEVLGIVALMFMYSLFYSAKKEARFKNDWRKLYMNLKKELDK